MTYRIRHLAIAFGLTALAAFLTIMYVANDRSADKRAVEQVTVLVAGKTIEPGTSGTELSLTEKSVPRNAVAPDAITEESALTGLVARETTYKGEQVIASRFASAAVEGLRGDIRGKLRVVQLPGDEHQLLAGTLEAGDRVDLVGTWSLPEGGQKHVSSVMLRNLRVLDPATEPGDSEIGADENAAVKLAVTDEQAQRLLWVAKHGAWMLQLRPARKAQDSKQSMASADNLTKVGTSR